MSTILIGRQPEQTILKKAFQSEESEMVAA